MIISLMLPVYHNRLHRCIKIRVSQDRLDKDEEQSFLSGGG